MTRRPTLQSSLILRYVVASLFLLIISGSANVFADPVSSSAPAAPAASATSAPPESSPNAFRDKWALVVGVSKFAQGIESLPGAAKDATDFAQFLTRDCDFKADHVKLLTDDQATRAGILAELGNTWLPQVASPADLVVVYISTAGTASGSDGAGLNYLCAYDTLPDKLFSTGIDAASLYHSIQARCHAHRLVLIVDASYSGGAAESGGSVAKQGHSKMQDWGGAGRAILCSSQSNQRSYECKTKSNSAFTYQFMQAARKLGKTASLKETFDVAAATVATEVSAERQATQTPVASFSGAAGQLQIAAPGAPKGSEAQSK